MAMLGILDTRIFDIISNEIFYIDEIVVLENVQMIGGEIERKDFELYWKTELEANRETNLAPILRSPANLYSMDI